jgi:Fic family protein
VLLRSESASSSQIENLTSAPRAIAEAAIGENLEGNGPLIVSNVRAMEAAIALSDELSNHSLIRMHDALLSDSDPGIVGDYRREQVWIGGSLPHSARFVPPHHDRVRESMDDLIRFTQRTDLPVLVQAAIAHAQFETVHPFPDGNGRVGRALLHAMLRHGGVLRNVAVPVSAGLLSEVDSYFEALTRYREGDPGRIIDVFASASVAALVNADTLAKDLAELELRWEVLLSGIRSDAVARRLATATIGQPVLNLASATALTGASKAAVGNGLAQLVERGVLAAGNSKKRNRIWINADVLDALTAFAERSGRRQSGV